MAGPWEKYQQPTTEGPWAKYAGKQESFGESHAGQALSGVNEGIGNMLGMPVDLANTALGVVGLGSETPFLGSKQINEFMAGIGSIKPETDDPGKQMARRVGEEFGMAAVPFLGTVGKAAAPLRMLGAEAAMAAGSGAGAAVAEQMAPDDPLAELFGQVAGGLSAAGATGLARKAITPLAISPERRAAAQTLKREGVELTAGQQSGNKALQYAESELGGARIADINEQQAEQFTSAVLKRAGVSANRATPEVVDTAFANLGRQFDDLARQSGVPMDHQLGSELGDVVREYRELVPESMRAPAVEGVIADLINGAQNSNIVPGEAYQALRSRLDRMARGAKADPQLSGALFGIRNALDNAVERHLSQTNPELLGQWRQVRTDYRNMLVVEKAAQGAGENAAVGLISPAALRGAAVNVMGKRSYVRGQNDYAELAQAGQATMSPLPQSGTAPRQAARNLGTGVLSLLGAGAGSAGGPAGAMAGAVAGAAVPSAVSRALLSRAGRKYLTNNLLPKLANARRGVGTGGAVVGAQSSNPSVQNALALRMDPFGEFAQ